MAEQKQKQQVGSKKVNELRPLDNGINITVKAISKKTIAQRNRLAECLVGDDTGIIIFTARNDQGNFCFCNSCGLIPNALFRSLIEIESLLLNLDFCLINAEFML